MKYTIYLTAITSLVTLLWACQPGVKVEVEKDAAALNVEMTYDSALAQKLGADEYGMKRFVMAFLKTGPNQDLDSTQAAELQRAHLDNIFRLADEGKLVLAGPFLDKGELRGVYVFDVASIEEAKALTETDPAIKAGRFVMELHPWYGSAATCMINDQHQRVAKKKI